jgi:hypothetical protein
MTILAPQAEKKVNRVILFKSGDLDNWMQPFGIVAK